MNFLSCERVPYDVATHLQTGKSSRIWSLNFDPKGQLSTEQTFISRAFEYDQCFIFTYHLFVVGEQTFSGLLTSMQNCSATANSLWQSLTF